jgi:hypothetical protein
MPRTLLAVTACLAAMFMASRPFSSSAWTVCASYPYTLTNGTTADAMHVMGNFFVGCWMRQFHSNSYNAPGVHFWTSAFQFSKQLDFRAGIGMAVDSTSVVYISLGSVLQRLLVLGGWYRIGITRYWVNSKLYLVSCLSNPTAGHRSCRRINF